MTGASGPFRPMQSSSPKANCDATHVATLDAFIEFVMDTKAEDHEEE